MGVDWLGGAAVTLAVVAGAALLAALILYLLLRLSLPRKSGRLRLAGLEAPAEILRDDVGVPHVFAASARDAYFCLGYLHAQDRLWQMEMQRCTGRGRMGEVLGRRVLPLDRFMRTLGLAAAADRAWERLAPGARTAAEAYAAGVNAWLESRPAWRLAPELALLRHRPERWTGADVVLFGKLLAWGLGGSYVTELLRHDLIATLGAERAAELMPDPPHRPVAAEAAVAAPPTEPLGAGPSGLPDLDATGEGAGSNLWAVSGEHTSSGAPLLANDPHLPSSAPLNWYLAHLRGGDELDACGATIPGLPVVVAGRNRHLAWGLTNLNPDVQDLFRERLSEDGSAVESAAGPVPLEVRLETLRWRGGGEEVLEVKEGPRGPLVSGVIGAGGTAREDGEPLALSWTGLAEDDTTLQAFLDLNRARDWDEFRDALALCVAPAVNFGYADRQGHVGYQSAGRVPLGRQGDGSLPAEGWREGAGWSGFVPFDDLPSGLDPPSGLVVSVNGKAPGPSAHPLGRDWVEPYREERIREVLEAALEAADGATPRDHAALQQDVLSLHARELLPRLLRQADAGAGAAGRDLAPLLERLRRWDGEMRGNSVAAALFAAWVHHLPPRLLADDELPGTLEAQYFAWTTYVQAFVGRALERAEEGGPAVTEPVTRALEEAAADLRRRLGDDVDGWRWDRLHRAVFPHLPFHNVKPLRRFFSRSSPRGGDWSTVNLGTVVANRPYLQRMVPGYRQVVDLGDPGAGGFIQALGQSGHFLSPHYDDLLAGWEQGDLRPMVLDRQAAEASAVARLELVPLDHPTNRPAARAAGPAAARRDP